MPESSAQAKTFPAEFELCEGPICSEERFLSIHGQDLGTGSRTSCCRSGHLGCKSMHSMCFRRGCSLHMRDPKLPRNPKPLAFRSPGFVFKSFRRDPGPKTRLKRRSLGSAMAWHRKEKATKHTHTHTHRALQNREGSAGLRV